MSSAADRFRGRTDFDRWLSAAFAEIGSFTALVVLVNIGESKVTPLRSTFMNIIGDETYWMEVVTLLQSSGVAWNGVAFFPVTGIEGGPLDNAAARARLREIEERLADDRLVLNEGHFFDEWGRRLKIEEVPGE
ncbi:MAG TPA: hypothetical protein VNQ34_02130 [Xanthobacteraceae bacterium]|nr:hypothetical protein [Xanthobacteraceae bacterium]